jgi:hypothetical protein
MENKQTPVEWYKERLKYRFLNGDTEESIYEQAIAIEKEQHFESYRRGNSFLDANTLDFEGYFEEYYKETYGK